MKNLIRYLKLESYSFILLLVLIHSCDNQNNRYAISFDGNKIHYIAEGRGDTAIVFVHGWSGEIDNWKNQIPEFSKERQVIALDLIGFGKSESSRDNWSMESFGKDIIAVLKDKDIDKAILVGHSMGGFAILEALKLDPDRILGLVPVDVFHNPEEKASDEEIETRISRSLEYIRSSDTTNTNGEITDVVRFGWKEALWQALHWKNDNLRNLLSQVDAPIVCINSDRYPIRFDIALKYNSQMDYKIIKGTGHGVMVESPIEFNNLLSETIMEIEENKHRFF